MTSTSCSVPASDNQSGLIFVLNNRSSWNGAVVQTNGETRDSPPQRGTVMTTTACPAEKWTNESGAADFWAPPRGYAVYLPV